jgi:mRNA interferase MazF
MTSVMSTRTGPSVAPPTSGGLDRAYPFDVLVTAGEAGLPRALKVVLDQIRTVDKSRLGTRIGSLTVSQMLDVDRAIRISLAV